MTSPRDIPPLMLHAPPDCDLADRARAVDWEAFVRAFRRVDSCNQRFTLADLTAYPGVSGRLHDDASQFEGRASIPRIVASTIRTGVGEIVLDRTAYSMSKGEIEAFSTHARVGGAFQMIDVARLRPGAKPVDRVSAVLESTLRLRDSGSLLCLAQTPILASQVDANSDPIRMRIARDGLGYAMRLPPERWFYDIGIHRDAADDSLPGYEVEVAFAMESEVTGQADVMVLPMRHLRTESRMRIVEYLLRLRSDGQYHYFVARPEMPLRAAPSASHEALVLALAHKAMSLPDAPLADSYGANKFHHPNHETWENVIMIVARAAASMTSSFKVPLYGVEG